MRGGANVMLGVITDLTSPNITVACAESQKAKCEAVQNAFKNAGVESKRVDLPTDKVAIMAWPEGYPIPKDAKGNVIPPPKDNFILIMCNQRKMTL